MNKGFTLIELLSVIILLIIILLIVSPNIVNLINNTEEKTYLSKEKLIAKGAEDYVLYNKISVPTVANAEKLINIDTLSAAEFTSDVYDLTDSDLKCLGYVIIKKNTNYGCTYKTCLFCENYTTNNASCLMSRFSEI